MVRRSTQLTVAACSLLVAGCGGESVERRSDAARDDASGTAQPVQPMHEVPRTAVVVLDDDGNVVRWDLETGAVRRIAGADGITSFTCDAAGATVAYANAAGVHVASADRDPVTLAEIEGLLDGDEEVAESIPPSITPDGARVAWVTQEYDDEGFEDVRRLYVARADGRGDVVEVDTAAADIESDVLDVSWSPDGSRLAVTDYESIVTLSAAGDDAETVVSDRDGGISTIRWSPDGTRIAWLEVEYRQTPVEQYEVQHLAVVEAAPGATPRIVQRDLLPATTSSIDDVHEWPAWSPDSRSIAYVGSASTAPSSTDAVFVTAAAEPSHLRALTTGAGHHSRLGFAAGGRHVLYAVGGPAGGSDAPARLWVAPLAGGGDPMLVDRTFDASTMHVVLEPSG